jgi:xanthine dehydrogenase accessory factor
MKKKLAVWRLIRDSLEASVPVMLLYVLESKGSSPGRQGFFMAVAADGKMEGSIGGGIMEHKFVEMARDKFKVQSLKFKVGELKKQIHDKSAAKNQSGMICSGEQTVWFYHVQQKDESSIAKIISCFERNENATLQLSAEGIGFLNETPVKSFYFSMKDESDWEYQEKLGYHNHLYIVGSGHCALALSKLMSAMDFYIHLFDDREDLLTMNQNDSVHEKRVVKSYKELASLIPSGENNYVVVMTFGYRTDDMAVRALLPKDFKYFGLLGSKKKIEKMFDDYKKEGISEALLKKIHAPIGIQIKSETSEEIAVSIAAEIINIKNQ